MGRIPALLVSIALAFVSGFALSDIGDAAHSGDVSFRGSTLDVLKVDQSVGLSEDAHGRWKIMVMPSVEQLPYKVVEIGKDFVTIRDIAGISDRLIPIYSIHSIETILLEQR